MEEEPSNIWEQTFSTSAGMLLVLRCLVFVGVCVEFVAAVAWLAELFPEPARRERVLGYTQAFSSLGGLMVATANGLCVAYAASLPAITGLIVRKLNGRAQLPGDGFFTSNYRIPGDRAWWLEQIRTASVFDWQPYLNQ